jgi:hypothetical protein
MFFLGRLSGGAHVNASPRKSSHWQRYMKVASTEADATKVQSALPVLGVIPGVYVLAGLYPSVTDFARNEAPPPTADGNYPSAEGDYGDYRPAEGGDYGDYPASGS